jgi:hypothetical protein
MGRSQQRPINNEKMSNNKLKRRERIKTSVRTGRGTAERPRLTVLPQQFGDLRPE